MHHEDDLDAWQIAAIREGMADLAAGRVVSHEEIVKAWEAKRACLEDKPV